MGPELGLVLPGLTVICTDSHTCTNGGIGALAFGVGSSESTHALATQTLRQRKPRQMRIRCDNRLAPGVTAKDLALHILGALGADAAVGHAVEFAGEAIDELEIEGRLTLCNLSVEMGARVGMIAPEHREDLRVPAWPPVCAAGRRLRSRGASVVAPGHRRGGPLRP